MIEDLGLKKDSIFLYAVNDNAENLLQYFCDIHTLQLGVHNTFNEVEGSKVL